MACVEQVAVPERARELAGLDRVDYADAFAVAVSAHHSPEDWIRLAAAGMPGLFASVRAVHHLLGLQLASADSPDHVIGWDTLRTDGAEVVLGNAGVLGAARIVGLTAPGRLVIVTLIALNGLPGRALWAVAAPGHRAVARRVLGALPTLERQRASR
jgi:hypothetical protein